jgi:isoquinoline 1-oxidoreductase
MNPLDEAADILGQIEPERYELREPPRWQFELDRRDFFKLVGGGIVVCLLADPVEGLQQEDEQQPPPRSRRGGAGASQELSAWLHIDPAGKITVYTGKVEIGQNIRTSLTQAVAEELRVGAEAIELVMADTDLVPFDLGTFGSQTTPTMANQLRKVGATTRAVLVELAAEQLGVPADSLKVADGKVTHPPTGRSLGYGELAKGQKLTKTVSASAAVTPAAEWKVEGTSLAKVDGRAIVTGKHRYASDIARPGMLFGKIVRPENLGAKIESVDLAAAQTIEGVTVVRDGEFVGVAAPSVRQADRAVEAIEVQWKPGPKFSDRELFAEMKKATGSSGSRGGRSNYNRGSIESGLAEADHKVETSYTVAYIAHCPLEPRAAVAEWVDGTLTVWTGTQRPFGVRGELVAAFKLKPEQVRVIVPDMGSGYGGKHTGVAAFEAARLAKAAGKPVKLVWTREEEFTWAYFRPAGVIDVHAGASKDGTLVAWDFHNYNSGASAIRTLYEVPHQRIAFHSAPSPLKQGSYRALAATANHFARESHMDALAHAVGLDTLEFRLKNLKDARLRGVLEAVAKAFGWGSKKAADGHGFGIAGGSEKNSYVATAAEVAVDRTSGKVQVVRAVTAFECGTIMNPEHLKNQVEGAVVMGLGGALFEAIRFEDGVITNPKFSRYRVPRFSDLPQLETVLLDRKDLPSIGAGETPIVCIAPAIAEAIFNATGVRLTNLPMVPDGLKV